MKNTFLILLALFLSGVCSYAQEKEGVKPNFYSKSVSMREAPSLSSKSQLIPAGSSSEEMKDGRYSKKRKHSKGKKKSKGRVIIGKGTKGDDQLAQNQHPFTQKIVGKIPEHVFDTAVSDSKPTDPSLAVGPNHVLAVFNTGFIIFDKDGKDLTGPLDLENVFSASVSNDFTASYDNAADRWVLSALLGLTGPTAVAVSKGPDPINDGWSVYSFEGIGDYNKLSVWSDAYYLTSNVHSENAATTNVVFAVEREAMIAGAANAQSIGFPLPGISTPPLSPSAPTGGFYSPQAFNVSSNDLPAAGNAPIVYLQDDAYQGVTSDHLKIWIVNVDFTTPENSTISQPTELPVTPFIGVFDGGSDVFDNLTQPNGGVDIDALQNVIMNQAQFRKFPTHNSAVFNFVVNTKDSGELAGIRWYELRQTADNQPWVIHQEGTYTSPDGKHAWMASMTMDGDGNIGMGYTGMGGTTNTFVSSYYTGRFADDPLGTMTISETLIAAGSKNFTSKRYGDYSKIDIDPANDKKFWFVTEYNNAAGDRANVAGVFQIAATNTLDAGVTNINLPASGVFTANQEIKVNIFNYGKDPINNFNITYQIDGGALITETFTGTIAPAQNAEYTFTQTADLSIKGQTYKITSSTVLSGDADAINNSTTANVINLFLNDIGITEITSPLSNALGLGNDGTVTVTITNFGGEEKSNFMVSYSINGGAAVEEIVAGPVVVGGALSYTFTQKAALPVTGAYEIVATTNLANDVNTSNDSMAVNINNLTCLSKTNDTAQTFEASSGTITSIINFMDNFIIDDINLTLNVTHNSVEDVTATLTAPDGVTVVELTSGNGSFGNDYIDTVFDDEATLLITDGKAPFRGAFQPEGTLTDFDGLSSVGDWTLTVTESSSSTSNGKGLLNWTLQFCGGKSPGTLLSVEEEFAINSDLKILDKGDNQFELRLDTNEVSETLRLDIYNIMGQRLLSYKLNNEGGRYSYNLDMSYAQSGVYIVKLSDNKERRKTGRIIKR